MPSKHQKETANERRGGRAEERTKRRCRRRISNRGRTREPLTAAAARTHRLQLGLTQITALIPPSASSMRDRVHQYVTFESERTEYEAVQVESEGGRLCSLRFPEVLTSRLSDYIQQ